MLVLLLLCNIFILFQVKMKFYYCYCLYLFIICVKKVNFQFYYYCSLGTRDNTKTCDLSDILPEDIEARVKTVAEMSMGTEITEQDITNIWYLCDQVGFFRVNRWIHCNENLILIFYSLRR